jgi:quinoprotein glucose dehydrogenase
MRARSGSRRLATTLVAAMAVLAGSAALLVSARADLDWPTFGGTPDNSRYITAKQLTKDNVAQLAVAWSYPFADTSFNPTIVDGVMYGRGRNGSLVALDAKTGKELWIHESLQGMTTRGLNYWESKDGRDRRLIFSVADYLQEVDARTGKSITTFGTNGAVDLREGLGRQNVTRIQSGTPGEIFENLIILGSATGEGYMSPPGDIRAFDVVTGTLVWQFHTVPHPGELGYDTWPKDAYKYVGGTNAWGEITIDTKRGIVFVPTGSPTYDYYGADRVGANLFADCLLALDVRTGKRLWHFQTVHHDLWDFDNNAAPQLTTIRKDGKRVDVVAMASKNGFLYVFNRDTGEPIWPIEERPVPKSEMPGEQSWPTQPFPTVVPPFAKQSFTLDDINPYPSMTDEQREAFKARVAKARNFGLFTPIDFVDTLHIPGNNGGALFGSTASEPNGIVYVITQDNPALLHLLRPGEARAGGAGAATTLPGQPIYQRECAQCHGADRAGTADGPSLLPASGAHIDPVTIRTNVMNGYGRMDPVVHITPDELDLVIAYLNAQPQAPPGFGRATGPRGAGPNVPPGLIVASGPSVARPPAGRGRFTAPPYPDGVPNTPRYVINEYGTIGVRMKPPFTTLVKYDLNVPEIKWRVGVGDDPVLAAYGITGTGETQMRTTPIVTATGLIFIPGEDNKVRAYDAETGKVLWTGRFGGTLFKAAPSMYEVDGRQYLVVPASGQAPQPVKAPIADGPQPEPVTGPLGYVAYALPGK